MNMKNNICGNYKKIAGSDEPAYNKLRRLCYEEFLIM